MMPISSCNGLVCSCQLFGFMVGDTQKFLCVGWSVAADCFGFMVGDTHKFLCMGWSVAAHCFRFHGGTIPPDQCTKRVVLSLIQWSFDPLGLLTLLTITAKRLFQPL